MFKNKIELTELNKIYDDIYYSNFEDGDYALDVVTNLISEKEYDDLKINIRELEDIIEIILELYDELIFNLDNEGLSEISNYVNDRKEKILNRELDTSIFVEYGKYFDDNMKNKEDFDEDFENMYEDDLVEEVEMAEDDVFFEDDYDDY